MSDEKRCVGGVLIDAGPCSKCGAMPNESCRRPMPDPELTALRANLAASEYDCEQVRDELTEAGNREAALRARVAELEEVARLAEVVINTCDEYTGLTFPSFALRLRAALGSKP